MTDYHAVKNDDIELGICIDKNDLCDVYVLDELNVPRQRQTIDAYTNLFGRILIDFCKNNNMFIMNGRYKEDRVGTVTSTSTRTLSIIDSLYSCQHLVFYAYSEC